jgi:uncharacterized protein with NRDE domain
MCLILLAHRASPECPLIVAANRDELHERPTAAASFWADHPSILAGRDRRAGGTWLGVTRAGRWAAVTNVRDPRPGTGGLRSRGHLVSEFLRGPVTAKEYLAGVVERADEYDGFNLIVADAKGAHYFGNRGGEPRELSPGVYGLSNHLLDTPWPKVERGKRALRSMLAGELEPDTDTLLEILCDSEVAPDALLPDTGLGLPLERLASAPFILSPVYGTRSSTAIVVDRGGRVSFHERTYLPGGDPGADARFEFELEVEVAS